MTSERPRRQIRVKTSYDENEDTTNRFRYSARPRVPTPKLRRGRTDLPSEEAAAPAITFGEIEAAMGNLGWTWIEVGIAYIYVAPHARGRCNGRNYTKFVADVDYVYTQESFERYVRQDDKLMELIRENLDKSKIITVSRAKGDNSKQSDDVNAPPKTKTTTTTVVKGERRRPPPSSSFGNAPGYVLMAEGTMKSLAVVVNGVRTMPPPAENPDSTESDSSDDEPLMQKVKIAALLQRTSSRSTSSEVTSSMASDDLELSESTSSAWDFEHCSFSDDLAFDSEARKDGKLPSTMSLTATTTVPSSPLLDASDIEPLSKKVKKKRVVPLVVAPMLPAAAAPLQSTTARPQPQSLPTKKRPLATKTPTVCMGMVPLVAVLHRLSPHVPAPLPLLHREAALASLYLFVQKCLHNDCKSESIILHGPAGSGKTELLNQLKPFVAKLQMRTVDDRAATRAVHVVHVRLSNNLIQNPIDGAPPFVGSRLFVEIVAALEAEFHDCSYDPTVMNAETVCQVAFESVSYNSSAYDPDAPPEVPVQRTIFLLLDGLSLSPLTLDPVLTLFKMLYMKHAAAVHVVIATRDAPARFLHMLAPEHNHHRTVLAIDAYPAAALVDVVAARLVDMPRVPWDAVTFAARLVATTCVGNAHVVLTMVRRALRWQANDKNTGPLSVRMILAVAMTMVDVLDVHILACLPRVHQLIVYAAVVEYCGRAGMYAIDVVHELYRDVLLMHGAMVALDRSPEAFRSDIEWLETNGLATINDAAGTFTLFIRQDDAVAFFKANPVATLLQSVHQTPVGRCSEHQAIV
ncbi:Aste57867_14669 [Aphanomyces stellatus]|uniref:Aste57867_14669 protein n=1 Tax=Aphanomyces stellatus TaxID=120398 RepID=A0A485L197_9STRA|nr:hypothetical protein As57867_014614 [Aphanomyces stellatus]VFT91487.1 Aste57867_14669 [Aphanomyces stellatus]